MKTSRVMWVGYFAIAVTGGHHIYQALRWLLFVVSGFNSNPICSAKLSQLILGVDSIDNSNTVLLDEGVQVVMANLLSSTSVLHNVSKFHMIITLGCNQKIKLREVQPDSSLDNININLMETKNWTSDFLHCILDLSPLIIHCFQV